MKFKKAVALGLSATMGLGMLAGCGSDGKTESTAAPTALQPSTVDTAEEVTLKVSLWDYSKTQYYKTMIDGFMKKYPNVKVEVTEFDADNYEDVVTTQLSGKSDLDVVFMKGLPGLSALIEQGHVLALDDLLAADETWDAKAYSGLVEATQVDGKTYCVPFRKDNNLIFYNKRIFDEAGVKYPEDGMTMEEYYELAKQVTSGEGSNKVYGHFTHTWSSNVYIYARRIKEFNQMDTSTYDALKPYYEVMVKMQDEGVAMDFGTAKASSAHYRDVFQHEQAAMIQIGTWQINNLLEEEKLTTEDKITFDWGVCALPNDKGEGNTTAVGGVTPVAVGAYGKNPQWAWKFVQYVCGEEGAKVLAATGIVPGYNSPAVLDIFDGFAKDYEHCPEGLSKYLDLEEYVVEQPMVKNGKAASKAFDDQHSAIMTGSVGIDEGIELLKSKVQEQLDVK